MEEALHRAWVVIVTADDRVIEAILSGGMIRKLSKPGKILALTSQNVSSTSISKLATVFDEVVETQEDLLSGGQERERLLIHCLSLTQFKKLVIVDAGVVVQDQARIDNFDNDFLIPGANGNWKVVFLTPSKLSYERAMKFDRSLTTLEEIQSALEFHSGDVVTNGKHVVLPLQALNLCSTSTKDIFPFVEVDEGMLGRCSVTDGNAVASELEKELASMLADLRSKSKPGKQRSQKDWIAVVGMSCRFPEANSLEEYWEVLKSGKNTSNYPSKERIALSNMDTGFKVNLLKCGVELFDASFFGMSPTEATLTDPQGRLLLELSWEAFEDAGLRPEKLRDSPVGIFFGSWLQEYKEMMNLEGKPGEDFIRKYLGNGNGSVAAKLSYFYGFTGPNIATESGCSSSMIAVDLACKSLQQEECSLALAAGANIILQMDTTNKLVWAADGKCKTFDKGGDGYGRGEGVAVLVLKRYTDAVKDGDRIHGLILGSATSQEGLSRSYGSPTIRSEMMAMKNALKAAALNPNDVDYLEAHATGTEVGDPIEAAAIGQAYVSTEGVRSKPLLIGSGKTNIGHTESCSGIAAIIKVLLAMKYELIPPHINLQQLNPKVDFSPIPGNIPLCPVEWKRTSRPRIAGVSNFGITGTDVHMIIKEGPLTTKIATNNCRQLPNMNILTLSAKTVDALLQLISSYTQHLQQLPEDCDMFRVCYTANECRAHHPVRRAVVGQTRREIVASLQKLSSKKASPCSNTTLKICFVFTLSYERMTNEELQNFEVLYHTSPTFRMYMYVCNQAVSPIVSPIEILLNDTGKTDNASSLTCKFSCYFSLFKLWQTWGVKPELVLGHTFGQYVAKAAAGDWTLEEAFNRIKKMETVPIENIFDCVSMNSSRPTYISSSTFEGNLNSALEAVAKLGVDTILHIGFDKELGGEAECSKNTEHCWFHLVSTLASLYEAGYDVDWEGFYKAYQGSKIKVSLPHYPFQRKRFWFEKKQTHNMEVGLYQSSKKLHPLLGNSLPNASNLLIFQNRFGSDKQLDYLNDHVIGNQVIFPGAGFLEMLLAATAIQAGPKCELLFLTDFKIHHPLQLTTAGIENSAIQTVLSPPEDSLPGNLSISMQLGPEHNSEWKLYASSDVEMACNSGYVVGQNMSETIKSIQQQCGADPQALVEEFYANLAKIGLNYGHHFKPISKKWRGGNETLVEVLVQSSSLEKYIVYPSLLDAMLQCLILHVLPEISSLHVPVKIGHFVCHMATAAKLRDSGAAYILSDSEKVILMDNSCDIVAIMGNPELKKTTVKTVLKAAAATTGRLTDGAPTTYEVVWKPSAKLQTISSLNLSIAEDYTDSPSFRSLVAHLKSINKFTSQEKLLDEKMDELCDLYVLKAFYEMGWKPEAHKKFELNSLTAQFNIVTPLIPAFRHFFGYLEKMGVFEKFSENTFIVNKYPIPENHIESSIHNILSLPVVKDYTPSEVVNACGSNLARALQGKLKGQQILFGSEDSNGLNLAEFYYQNSRFYKNGAKAPAKLFEQLVTTMWNNAGGCGKKLRVLEIGAGTGSFTTDGLRLLEKNGIEYDYVFTDISSAFFSRASVKFQDYIEHITFKKLDIEKDPLDQGFQPAYFDVVVAVDVLHATKVLLNTLKRVEMLTKMGGSLILGETNKPVKEMDISFGILEGYWLYEDAEIRPSHCIITAEQWERLFKLSGYSGEVEKILTSNSQTCAVLGKLCQRPTPSLSPTSVHKVWILLTSSVDGTLYKHFIHHMANIGRQVVVLTLNNFGESWEVLKNQDVILDGMLYLIENADTVEPQSCKLLLEPLLTISQHFLQQSPRLPKLVVATVGLSWQEFESGQKCLPPSATLWGFVRSARMEMAGTAFKLVDLDPASDPEACSAQLIQEMWTVDDEETETMYRSNTRLVRRLCEKEFTTNILAIPKSDLGCYKLALPGSKLLKDLKYVSTNPEEELGNDEVVVEIRNASLNFKDVLCVMKPSSEFDGIDALGYDFSGVITAPKNCKRWKTGDRVMGFTPKEGTISSHIKVKEHVLAEIPHHLTFAEAATLPVAFATAWHCISNIAKMSAGQTILIHAASGGVGLMSIQVSKHLGLKIIGTAGSSRKRNFLKSLGVENVYSSRTLEYGKGIQELTNGKGVDLVLNCLTGPGFKETSLGICKEGGWFVELSKLDVWTPTEVSKLNPSVNYEVVDILTLEQKLHASIMDTLVHLLEQKVIEPVPSIRYSATRVIDALSFLQKAKHIGKIVIDMPQFDAVEKCFHDYLFNPQSTYLITGGKGGIGFAIAKWMLSNGAKYIVLLGRSPPKPELLAEMMALNNRGSVLISMEADVSDFKQCEKVFRSIEQDPALPQLRGVHHCTGVLSDRMVVQQSWEDFEYVMAPKVDGAFNLHKLAEGYPLEFFVVHSSMSCTFGNVGQSNYSAANAYMESLAEMRHWNGLKGMAISWGQWNAGLVENMEISGYTPMSVEEGIAALERCFVENLVTSVVGKINFDKICKLLPSYANTFLQELTASSEHDDESNVLVGNATSKQENIEEEYKKSEGIDAKQSLIKTFVRDVVCETLGVHSSEFDDETMFTDMGMDSLLSIEFFNKIQHRLKQTKLGFVDMLDNGTATKMSEIIINALNCPT